MAKLLLTAKDRICLDGLLKQGILEPITKHLLPKGTENGTISVICADGDQSSDLFHQHGETCGDRCHVISFNGGALLLSPLLEDERSIARKALVDQDLPEAIQMKEIHTVALYGHLPCGIAQTVLCCDAFELIGHLVQAKMRLKEGQDKIKFLCFLHVDWGNAKKNIYWVNGPKWRSLIASNAN